MGALTDLVNAGKVRYLGVSNLYGWQMQKVVNLCKYEKYPLIVCLQVLNHIFLSEKTVCTCMLYVIDENETPK